jgi:hypothetical protein
VWISKVSEVIGSSDESFEAAARSVIERANRTLRGINGIEVTGKSIKVDRGEIVEFRVRLRLFFDVAPPIDQHW